MANSIGIHHQLSKKIRLFPGEETKYNSNGNNGVCNHRVKVQAAKIGENFSFTARAPGRKAAQRMLDYLSYL